MKKTLLVFVLVILAIATCYAQTSELTKFSSKTSRVETRKTENGSWQKEDFAIYHLIVFDMKNKKINTYHESTKDNDLDVLSMKKETTDSGTTLIFDCVDDENLQCKAVLTSLYLRLEYSLLRITYYIDK